MTIAIEILRKELRFNVAHRNALIDVKGVNHSEILKMDQQNRDIALGIKILKDFEVKELEK